MIQIFDIKKAKKNLLKANDTEELAEYIKESQLTVSETLEEYKSGENSGLTTKEANFRLEQNGKNKVVKEDNKSWFYFYINSFKDQFIIILLFLAIINFCLGDKLGSAIIIAIAVISANIRFVQDYSVYKFNKQLKNRITSKTNVLRDNKEQEIKVEDVVIGDIIKLNAGAIIPADVKIIESKDLFINQSVFTGESAPIEKKVIASETKEIFDIENICLMGASVISGKATAVVIRTGFKTYLGKMGKEVDVKKESTNFEKGMKNITNMLIKYMIVVCFAVLIIDGVIKGNFNEAILFALSVAVGITPSMLPMIVNVNLTKGSKSLAKKKTLVKRIESIQNLGAIDILCTDKTGTLTEDKITLQKYIDIEGKENMNILEYAYLNSFYGTGMKNLVDRAILAYGKEHQIEEKIEKYEKIDEIPFDYDRKKMSVIVKKGSQYRMITKGALEEVIKSCTKVKRKRRVFSIFTGEC